MEFTSELQAEISKIAAALGESQEDVVKLAIGRLAATEEVKQAIKLYAALENIKKNLHK